LLIRVGITDRCRSALAMRRSDPHDRVQCRRKVDCGRTRRVAHPPTGKIVETVARVIDGKAD
jgi:hypothetical protein